MTPRAGRRLRFGGDGERGQMVALFAICLIVMVAMAGLLIDGGLAWTNRRQAQAAADTAALAAAQAAATNTGRTPLEAAQAVAALNGFQTATDCAGNPLPNLGVTINRPPSTGAHTIANDPDANDYVEVVTSRRMATSLSGAIGISCFMVSARAVASISTSSVAECSFCSLNNSNDNHTLVLNNGATLRVDGDIYVNSTNGGTTPADCTSGDVKDWKVCGDGFDIFGAGGRITARTIAVVGGWETHDDNPTKADGLALQNTSTGMPCSPASGTCVPCPLTLDPPNQTSLYPALIPSNVCLHMPRIPDPLNDPANPKNIVTPPSVGSQSTPVAGVNGCPAGAKVPNPSTGVLADIGGFGTHVICPGKYTGGVTIKNSAVVTMMPGIYYMVGGGFQVTDSASLDGSSGVMIYNSSGSASAISTSIGTDLVPVCVPATSMCIAPSGINLTSSDTSPAISQVVTLKMVVDKNGAGRPSPTGKVTFYDGDTVIAGCSDVPLVTETGSKMRATCDISWAVWGSHHIASTYFGDLTYKPVGDTVTVTIAPPSGSGVGPVTIDTTGNVKLYGLPSGPYAGLTIFQERGTEQTVTINPGSGLGTCTGDWLTADIPHVPGVDPPDACGPLGGFRGTIYAPASGSLVLIESSGLADLQVISGMIQITSDADTRFAYTPQFFANGKIRLVE